MPVHVSNAPLLNLVPSLRGALRTNDGKSWFRENQLSDAGERLVADYDGLSHRERTIRFGRGYNRYEASGLKVPYLVANAVRAASALHVARLKTLDESAARLRKKMNSMSIAEVLGLKPDTPAEREEIRKYLCSFIQECACGDHEQVDAEVPASVAPAKYTLTLESIICRDKQAWPKQEKDEIFARYVVVDGEGDITTGTTGVYIMDNGHVQSVDKKMYGTKAPKGYLDAAVDLVEDDTDGEGIRQAEAALKAAAKTVAGLARGNIYAEVAAGVLHVAGVIAGSFTPKDDLLASQSVTLLSDEEIEAKVGRRIRETYVSAGGNAFGETASRYQVDFRLRRLGN